MNVISIVKAEATGNDFLILENHQVSGWSAEELKSFVVASCDRHFGVGADGLIVLKELGPAQWSWDFFNSDGSSAEMCGNATRCVGRFVSSEHDLQKFTLETEAGEVAISVNSGGVRSELKFLNLSVDRVDIETSREGEEIWYVNSGVPHFVVVTSQHLQAMADLELIQKLRHHQLGGGRGANVTILTPEGAVCSFERGVEGFTLACGTGAIAGAVVLMERNKLNANQNDIVQFRDLVSPGGKLRVELTSEGEVSLTGPARIICHCDYFFESTALPNDIDKEGSR
jgi:diaminopimelate epimerase